MFQSAHDGGSDAGRMPIHPQDAAKGLEPEGITQAREELGRSEVVENTFSDGGTECPHALGKPRGYTSSMERKIGDAGALQVFHFSWYVEEGS